MLTYAVGDLHGRKDLFHKALREVARHSQGQPVRFIVLGDFIDRGPESAGLIAELRKFNSDVVKSIYGQPCQIDGLVLRGNHENMMLDVLGLPVLHNVSWWMGNGGWSTLKSYGYTNGELLEPLKPQLEDDLRWIMTLPHYYETEKQVFVHAAVLPDVPMAEQPTQILTWECYDKPWLPTFEEGVHAEADYPKHVVHGHVQFANGPILLESRTDLDTFAWATGRLAIGVFDDRQGPPVDILWAEGEPDARYVS